jgi:hypothetical protein
VQTLLSLQVIGVKTQPVAESQVSVVQALLSLQAIGVKTQPATASQVSVVQALLSLQVMGVWTQPVAASQESVVQASSSSQSIGAKTQPVAASQESAVHALLSLQMTGVDPPTQAPPLQASPVKQAFASLHGAVLLACWQPRTESHESSVHTLVSSQPPQQGAVAGDDAELCGFEVPSLYRKSAKLLPVSWSGPQNSALRS